MRDSSVAHRTAAITAGERTAGWGAGIAFEYTQKPRPRHLTMELFEEACNSYFVNDLEDVAGQA